MITTTLRSLYHYLLILTLLSAVNTYSQKGTIRTLHGKSLKAAHLTEKINDIIEDQGIPGVSVALINDNELVYHNALGVSNIETKNPVDAESIFEAASLSKPIFAYFALKMVEQGKLDLDRPLYEYLPHPGFAPESEEDAKLITARMVLAHQTGMPNHSFGERITLAFKPGTSFEYSGEAYQYLAAVIGSVTGVGWKSGLNELFRKVVAKPLEMTHSTFVWDDYIAKHKVFGHDENDGTPKSRVPSEGYWENGVFSAYSSLHSEAREYAQFVIAMLKEEGLKPETFEVMLKEQTHFDENNPLRKEIGQTGWGLGFAQKRTPDLTMHMHTGNNHDFQAYAMFVPEKDYGLVVFTNSAKMIPFLTELSKVLGAQF